MTIKNAKALLAAARENKKLAEKLEGAGPDGFGKAAQEAGHPCTVEHMHQAMMAVGELSDGDLDGVSGGAVIPIQSQSQMWNSVKLNFYGVDVECRYTSPNDMNIVKKM